MRRDNILGLLIVPFSLLLLLLLIVHSEHICETNKILVSVRIIS